mgnify:CR=1 FL=1
MSEIRFSNPIINSQGNEVTIGLSRFSDGGSPENFASPIASADTGSISFNSDIGESLSANSFSIFFNSSFPSIASFNINLNRTVYTEETITYSTSFGLISDNSLTGGFASSVLVSEVLIDNGSVIPLPPPPDIIVPRFVPFTPFGKRSKSNTETFRSTVRDGNTFINFDIDPEPEFADWEIRLKSGRDTTSPLYSKFRIFNTRKVSPNIDTIRAESATSFFVSLNRQNTYQVRVRPKGGSFSEWRDIVLNSDIRILGARHFDRYKLTRKQGTTRTEHLNPQFSVKRKNGIRVVKQIFSAKGRKRSI